MPTVNGDFQSSSIWMRTLAPRGDEFESARTRLRDAYLRFRERISLVVANINSELPLLTIHDVTHLDALWRTASEIAGNTFEINAAEAFVLGGSILLHDAAHALIAYPGGLAEIRATLQWKDLVAQRFNGSDPDLGSQEGKLAVFEVLRHLHAKQSENLLSISWRNPASGEALYLLTDDELRGYYSKLIGVIAASHHWPAHRVTEELSKRLVTAPPFLTPANWTVDALKIALLLRTADATHVDSQRAPTFALALRQPTGLSLSHWQYQNKLGQPTATENGELMLTSASSFPVQDRNAWWLAYDTACMINRELRDAHSIMRDEGRETFHVQAVLGLESPETFSRQVQTDGWVPVDATPRINNIPHVVEMLGGASLYGDDYSVPLRELIQNASDAIRALRALGGLAETEGEITVSLQLSDSNEIVLSVTDTGIGMSRHVLTHVLMDFGNSLWSGDQLRDQWPGLASTGFSAAGRFGIGFFSIFMLGSQVVVNTRRHARFANEDSDQWTLGFDAGVRGRPWLRKSDIKELLPRSGTKISITLTETACQKLSERWHGVMLQANGNTAAIMKTLNTPMPPEMRRATLAELQRLQAPQWQLSTSTLRKDDALTNITNLVSWLCPASEVAIRVRCLDKEQRAVIANDWISLSDGDLLTRLRIPNSTPLYSLKDDRGQVIGRLGIGIGFAQVPAALVHKGIRCGQFSVMTGLAIAKIPTDVHRQKALVDAAPEAWCSWMKDTMPHCLTLPLPHLRMLHALCRDIDIPIVIVGGQLKTFTECRALLATLNSVTAFFDDLGQMAWDPPFGILGIPLNFTINTWIFPNPQPHAIEEIPHTKVPVGYKELFEKMLADTWGVFDTKEQVEGVLALAGVHPIMREGPVYTRKPAGTH